MTTSFAEAVGVRVGAVEDLSRPELTAVNVGAIDAGALPTDPVRLHNEAGTVFCHGDFAIAYLTEGA
ncbi:hypothetical protein EV379_0434 [Microterricola gilva]|uniref:Uncharacterized protein n=1 Tax=Microterricola gilva TaxID=393267 RepID=A0A4Q8AI84_9MICO|nr:hypothetical protein EV379_0434 [Microterricola gilva]